MASQSSIIACGPRMTMVAIGLKVVLGPALMAVASLVIGLRDKLFKVAIVAITPAKVPQPPFFRGYDSNATCACHGGASGHSIEHCRTLKHNVQCLIDAGWLKF